jgi:cytochrome c oxidase subunit 2
MPVLLALVIWLVCAAITAPFVMKTWWFPVAISEHARTVDSQIMLTFWVTGVVFILAHLALGWAVFKYGQKRSGPATYSHGNNTMEVVWTSAAAILFIGLVLMGTSVWARVHINTAPAGSLPVEVTGKQFVWNVRYPGPDGKLGALDIKQINDANGNPLGIDSKDPAGKDDITFPNLVVPVNRSVEVTLHSLDVTHSFFVPELRLKQDAVPGMTIKINFIADKVGLYELPCAELCGLGHFKMRAFLDVKEQGDFDKWMQERVAERAAQQ